MRTPGFLVVLLALAATGSAPAQVTIETPRGGWRDSEGDPAGLRQQVNYPASSVNALGQSAQALIKGHIVNATKGKPATLVVNGVPMPLSVDEQGNSCVPTRSERAPTAWRCAPPTARCASARSSSTLMLPSPRRGCASCSPGDSDGTDLDLHVVSPEGVHVFYGNRIGENGGALDVDVTTGYGPEIYANPAPPKGVYHVFVNYYGNGGDQQELTTAQIAIITQEGTVSEKRRSCRCPCAIRASSRW